MPNFPQGTFWFNGIQSELSASFTLSHGVTPSIATLHIPPQPTPIPPVGTLTIRYGSFQYVFPDMKVVDCHMEENEGSQTWFITLQDTRWRWKYGGVSGEYNVRSDETKIRNEGEDVAVGDKQRVREGTAKNARQLIKMCFDEIGVTADLTVLVDDVYPRVSWNKTRPDQALTEILDPLGLRVALNANNKVSVVRAGEGSALPLGSDVLDNSTGIEVGERPDKLIFRAAPTEYDAKLVLEAVGMDTDGAYKVLSELEYCPVLPSGLKSFRFTPYHSFSAIKPISHRQLAMQTVWRCYRIKEPFDAAGEKGIDARWRILPLLNRRVLKAKFGKREHFLPPRIFGRFSNMNSGSKDSITAALYAQLGNAALSLKTHPEGWWVRGFSLDTELGIVTFPEPVLRRIVEKAVTHYEPALMTLVVGVNLRDKTDSSHFCYNIERDLSPKLGTKPKYLIHEELPLRFWTTEAEPGVPKSNKDEVDAHGMHYLDAEENDLENKRPGTITYAGFKGIRLDGAIAQVTWWVDEEGWAKTRASRNTEHSRIAQTYQQRRFNEDLDKLLEDDKRKPPGA